MHQLQEAFRQTLSAGLGRRSVTSPSRWAQKYRILGPPYPGLCDFNNHTWTREMHNATHKYCIGQKAAQMGYTETVLNITFYKIDIERKNCLYILPAKTPDASKFSSSRFDAALELSPHLKNLFSNVKNVSHKRAGTANLFIVGSRSRSALKSDPVPFIVFDELDEMNQDNIPLGEQRKSGQPEWQIWKISTPTSPERGINKEFLLSTQDHFLFKCPHCSKRIELVFPDNLVIVGEHRLDPRIKESYYICNECKGKLEHKNKREFLATGIWVPFGEKQSNRRGFYINQMYSPTVEPWELAEKSFAAQYDATEEQEFYNSNLGLPHVPDGAQITDFELNKAITGRHSSDAAPDCKLITMGVDQGKWLHYEIDAWNFPRYTNDLNMSADCTVLAAGKVLDFSELGKLMHQWQVNFCVIDAQPERRLAYEFACEFWGHVKLCFYSRSAKSKMIQIDRNSESHVLSVDRTTWLDVALNRFYKETIKLPKDIGNEYRTHIKNLIRRYEKDADGNPFGQYINQGADHLGHARCYAEIALPCAASIATNENIGSFL